MQRYYLLPQLVPDVPAGDVGEPAPGPDPEQGAGVLGGGEGGGLAPSPGRRLPGLARGEGRARD